MWVTMARAHEMEGELGYIHFVYTYYEIIIRASTSRILLLSTYICYIVFLFILIHTQQRQRAGITTITTTY